MKFHFHYLQLFLLPVLFGMIACSETNEISDEEAEIIEYFKEVALGFEFGGSANVTRRWEEPIRIFVENEGDDELLEELTIITKEINALINPISRIEIVSSLGASNFHILLSSASHYSDLYPIAASLSNSNYGLFFITWNNDNVINKGHMYIDIYRPDVEEQKHLLREELTQALGLGRDSDRYPDSIFYRERSNQTSYSDLDKEIINLLYHHEMKTGLGVQEVEVLLKRILIES